MTNTAQQLGREYLRVSQDRSGRARSADEQHEDNLHAAAAHGFTLNGVAYSDVSVSASRYTRKVRGDFARLVGDLRAGRFGAQILVLWESSRGSRRVGEWASLVDLLEDQGVLVHVTTHGRTYDPCNARDRRSLMEDAVDSEYESGKASARIRRAAAATAAEGRPHGRTPYGYSRSYDPKTRKLVSQDPHPGEAPVVREIVTRLYHGHSLRAIAADFGKRGIMTRTGKPWQPEHLRDIALSPIYAGLRVHEPGNRTGRYLGPLDGAVKATWLPLVDPAVWHAVRAKLLSPDRKTSRPGRGVHLLSLIAVCGTCGGKLAARYQKDRNGGERLYQCRERSCVRIGADDLDVYAERVVLAYLARPDVIEQLRGGGEDPELAKVRAEIAAARAELASLRSLAARPVGDPQRISAVSFAAVEPGLLSGIAGLEARERELSTPPALAGLVGPGEDVAARWKAAPMSARREVARLLCVPALIGQLRVNRSTSPGHATPARERVTWKR